MAAAANTEKNDNNNAQGRRDPQSQHQPNVTVRVSGGANIQSMSINFNTTQEVSKDIMQHIAAPELVEHSPVATKAKGLFKEPRESQTHMLVSSASLASGGSKGVLSAGNGSRVQQRQAKSRETNVRKVQLVDSLNNLNHEDVQANLFSAGNKST